MNSVNGFKECMANTVNLTSLNETNWRSDNWKNLWSKVDQEVLTDAFEKHELVRSIFVDIGDIITRNCKSLPRVEKK